MSWISLISRILTWTTSSRNTKDVLCGEEIFRDDSRNCAVLAEGASAPHVTTEKVLDVISRSPGGSGPASDAVSADTQVELTDDPALLNILTNRSSSDPPVLLLGFSVGTYLVTMAIKQLRPERGSKHDAWLSSRVDSRPFPWEEQCSVSSVVGGKEQRYTYSYDFFVALEKTFFIACGPNFSR